MKELNKNEFMIASRGLADAKDLLSRGYPRDALFALRRPLRLLEQGAQKTRMLALVYAMQGDIRSELGKRELARRDYRNALDVLKAIDDSSELCDVLSRKLEQ